MNERTKQLWEESQQWNGSDDGRGGLKILESVEKFAELIVHECADLVDTLNEAYDAPSTAGKFIKAHFGIEKT
jgi:hypothetical protein